MNKAAELFRNHKGLAHHQAAAFSKLYQAPLHELEDVAVDMFVNLIMVWDKKFKDDVESCAETTFIYKFLSWRLATYCRRRKISRNIESLQLEFKQKISESIYSDLSDSAREILDYTFNSPEISECAYARSRKKIKKHFRNIGWDNKKINRCFKEVQLAL